MEVDEPFVRLNLSEFNNDLEFMSAGRNPSLRNTSLKGEQVLIFDMIIEKVIIEG